MKINTFRVSGALLAVTVLSTAPAHAASYDAAVEATPGLLGYYTFTGAAQANSVVNGYTGVLENGATVAAAAGPTINGSAASDLVLDNGASGTAYATAGGADPLEGGIASSGSIVAWIDLASLPSTYGRIYSIAGESAVGDDFDLQINGDNNLSFYTDGGSAVQTLLTASDVGNWIQIAATFTAGVDRSLYINGVLVASNVPGGHSATSAPFYQGQSNVFGGRYFDGAISDVAMFDTDLSGTQVSALYTASTLPSGVPEPAAWAMMIVGFGLVGGVTRRRRNPIAA
jgi:hypothetical protein